LRALFRDKRFRIALSHAIDRSMVRRLAYRNRALPARYNLSEFSAHYRELEGVYEHLRYDPERARELLDEAGLAKRDSDGYRLRPDGERLSLILETGGGDAALEIIRANWEAVGVRTTVKPVQRTLFHQRVNVNGEHMACNFMSGEKVFPLMMPKVWFGIEPGPWDHDWAEWFNTDGEKGEAPPPEVRRLQELYGELSKTTDPVELRAKMAEVVRIHADNVFHIPYIGPMIFPGVLPDSFGNVPVRALQSWVCYTPGQLQPETFYIKSESED
jgi:peptide/nickel transport system substrate-binding protein